MQRLSLIVLRETVNQLILARTGVRRWEGGAVLTSNPKDRARTKHELEQLEQVLTDLIEVTHMDMIQLIQKHWPTRHLAESQKLLSDLVNKLRFVCGCSYGTIVSIFQSSVPTLDLGEYEDFMLTLEREGKYGSI